MDRKKIGLVLGSGGARGLCFLGALKILEKNNIQIDTIAGCSMGAIIGSAWASGCSFEEMSTIASRLKTWNIIRPDFLGTGLFSNKPIFKAIAPLLKVDRIEDLSIPVHIACTDLNTGQGMIYTKGDLLPTVVASSLAAGVFTPVDYDGLLLVDGGYTNMVPANVLTDKVDLVITVDATVIPDWSFNISSKPSLKNFFNFKNCWDMNLKAIDTTNYHFNRSSLEGIEHIHITPDLSGITFMDFKKSDEIIQRGQSALIDAMPEIQKRLNST